MAFTYDLATAVGQVRLQIADTSTPGHIFEDEELTNFLTMRGGDVRLAAARALRAFAASQIRILKVIRHLDLQTDGAAVAKSLLLQAADLEKEVEVEASAGEGFDIAEMVYDPFTLRERVYNDALRDS